MTNRFVENAHVTEAGYDAWDVLVKNKSPDERIVLITEISNIHTSKEGVHVFLSVLMDSHTRSKAHVYISAGKCQWLFGDKLSSIDSDDALEKVRANFVGFVIEYNLEEQEVQLPLERPPKNITEIFDQWKPGDSIL
ncbi:hypothetical protein [Burkholderia ubonensis]|uniref:hypothetical protein n=1 Tax=Burkholderia ubonensis TaxID=101571 RepID=UPI000AD85069|nr:hypothetical protein [Burkholderia ubonensis]